MSERAASEQGVARRLEDVFASTPLEAPLEVGAAKLIAFSDHHRGMRDGADDFQRCERAYNAALAYYFHGGHTLVIGGDADDLWECRPAPVIKSYRHTLELEGMFHQEGRYLRIWGNHDDLWSHPGPVASHLEPCFPGIRIRQGVRLPFTDGGRPLGELFFVHGHQGDPASDRGGNVSRVLVRYLWRNAQRLTRMASTTPAQSWELGKRHDLAMQSWAASKAAQGVVLVTGHTHQPIFKSASHAASIEARLRREEDPVARQLLFAELEWLRTKVGHAAAPLSSSTPCYFNAGCSSFGDGDVTGLEVAGGEIRLVRWPDDAGFPKPKVLDHADLRNVFERITGGNPPANVPGRATAGEKRTD